MSNRDVFGFQVGDAVLFDGGDDPMFVTGLVEQNHPHYGEVLRVECGPFSAFDWHFTKYVPEGPPCPRCQALMEMDALGDWCCADCLMVDNSMTVIGQTVVLLNTTSPAGRLVYGTRSHRWHLVGPDDRDYRTAITVEEFTQVGPEAAKAKYLSVSIV